MVEIPMYLRLSQIWPSRIFTMNSGTFGGGPLALQQKIHPLNLFVLKCSILPGKTYATKRLRCSKGEWRYDTSWVEYRTSTSTERPPSRDSRDYMARPSGWGPHGYVISPTFLCKSLCENLITLRPFLCLDICT